MNVIMLRAWMLWSSDAVKHEHCGGHGCSGHRMQSNMNVTVVFWSSDALEHEGYYGLGMKTLVIGRRQA